MLKLSYHILKSIIIYLLDTNFSPSEIYSFVFNTIDNYIGKSQTKKVLYCANNFGFFLSDEFYEFIKDKYPDLYLNNLSLIIRERYDIVECFAHDKNMSIDNALQRIGYELSNIKVYEVPLHRSFRIIKYNDIEYVEILNDFSY